MNPEEQTGEEREGWMAEGTTSAAERRDSMSQTRARILAKYTLLQLYNGNSDLEL